MAKSRPAASRPGRVAAALVALVAVLVLAASLFPGDGERIPETIAPVRPTGSVWNELPTMPADPLPPPPVIAQADVTDCPASDEVRVSPDVAGFVVGGGLAFPTPAEWEPSREVAHALTDEQAVERRFGATALRSTMSVGAVLRAEGFMTPQEAAWNVFHCHVESARFPSNNMGYDRFLSRSIQIDGSQAWQIRVEVSSIRSGARGTMFDVVAVETGTGESLGVFLAIAMEAAGQADDDVRTAIEGLRLHG